MGQAADPGWFTPALFYWTIVVSLCLNFLFALFMGVRKLHRVCGYTANKVPPILRRDMNLPAFDKARNKVIDQINLEMMCECWKIIILTFIICLHLMYRTWLLSLSMISGWWPSTWDLEMGQTMAFGVWYLVFYLAVAIPQCMYTTLYTSRWDNIPCPSCLDCLCVLLCLLLCIVPVMAIIAFIFGPCKLALMALVIRSGGQYVFLWIWLFMAVVAGTVFSCYQKLFDAGHWCCHAGKVVRMEPGPLRSRLEALGSRFSFPLDEIYVADKGDNGQPGYWMNRQLVVYSPVLKRQTILVVERREDTVALEDLTQDLNCNDEEVEAILVPTLGHRKLNHRLKEVILFLGVGFVWACLLTFTHRNPALHRAFGFPEGGEMPSLLGFFMANCFLFRLLLTADDYLDRWLKTQFVFQADAFAVEQGYGEKLKSALVKLNKDNYAAWLNGSPGLIQRLEAIDRLQAEEEEEVPAVVEPELEAEEGEPQMLDENLNLIVIN